MRTSEAFRSTCAVALMLALSQSVSGADTAGVVINEVRAEGDDWIELYNAGAGPAELTSWRLVDSGPGGALRPDSAVRFPAGTVLPPGGYLLVVADRGKKARAGLQRNCLRGGPASCFEARWGINHDGGEQLRLIAPDGTVASEVRYPPRAVGGGKTWARRPDGSGAFGPAKPTPGRANVS